MKKLFVTLFLGMAVCAGANAQLLYKISCKNLEKPSYIIGTHHLANVGFVQKISEVKTALTETDQVYGELVMSDMQNADSVKVMQQYMQLPAGKTIKDVLTPAQFKEVDACLKDLMSVGFSSKEVMQQMGHITPQALLVQLTLVTFMTSHMGEFDPSSTFDQYFQAQAKKNNEPVGGLETISQQAKLLYDVPMKRQVEQLMCFVRNRDYNAKVMDELTDAFYAQDLVAMKKASDEKLGNSCDATPEETAAIIENRNKAWMEKMPAIMADKPTFFAVGALHLVGENGLLQLLKNAGYTVEGLK